MLRLGRSPQPLHAQLARQGADAIAEHRRRLPNEPLDLRGADLAGADLAGVDLRGADLRHANLDGARLDGADLHDARLREASLRDCSLAGARGLFASQLAGTDLTGAVLPDHIRVERLAEAARCGDSSEYARNIFMWMVGGCAFIWLMLISTTQLQLLTNDGVVKLPVFDVEAPSDLFFMLGPFLLVGVYIYLHVYMQRIWDALGGLPAVFPDGEPIDRKAHGWIVVGLVRWQWRRLRDRPRMFYSQTLLSVLLAWGLAPLTVYSVWRRCVIRHDWDQSIVQVIACACAAYVTVGSLLSARSAFTHRRNHLAHVGQWLIAATVLYGLHAVMQSTFCGRAELGWFNAKVVHYHPTDRTPKWGRSKRELQNEYLDGAPFLAPAYAGQRDPDFSVAVSTRLDDLGRRWREAYAEFSGPLLRDAHLEGCFIDESDLSSADMSGSSWTRATLSYADLTQANLQGASFVGAMMNEVVLVGAAAQGVELTDASAAGFYAMGADFSGGKLMGFCVSTPADLRKATLDDAQMAHCRLPKARLQGASLRGTDLRHAELMHADLAGADLRNAKLMGADLRGASLKGADLTGADLTDARFGELTIFYGKARASLTTLLDDANLSGAAGLTDAMIAAATYNDATRWDGRAAVVRIAAVDANRWEAPPQQLRLPAAPSDAAAQQPLLFDPPTAAAEEGSANAAPSIVAPLEKISLPSWPAGPPAATEAPYPPDGAWPSEPWPQ